MKTSTTYTRDAGLISRSGTSPGEGNGNTFQYSCLGNPTDIGGWWATVHGVAKSRIWLGNEHNYKAYVCIGSLNNLSVIKDFTAFHRKIYDSTKVSHTSSLLDFVSIRSSHLTTVVLVVMTWKYQNTDMIICHILDTATETFPLSVGRGHCPLSALPWPSFLGRLALSWFHFR